ncbi:MULTISPECIES: hypothetical protein [unclassified Acidovorax]|uniref:hypothetical protein n=1 Tax=unclassified Acidovorax TaxID=2684926 RepID=UPI000AFC0104|nr:MULTISPECIES: hypothetical protein [unclassified Acidovorax]
MFDPQCGGVQPKAALSPQPHHRAQETIFILNFILNLQGAGLPYMRSAAAYGYQQQLKQWAEYASQFPEADLATACRARAAAGNCHHSPPVFFHRHSPHTDACDRVRKTKTADPTTTQQAQTL